MLYRLGFLLLTLVFSYNTYAIDIGNESTADKADRFDFEEFHKEKGVTLWEDKKGEAKSTKTNTSTDTGGHGNAADMEADKNTTFTKGDTLKVREAYKLGNDPAQRSVQNLFDATEALHKQLNSLCLQGWVKEREWHQPEAGYFYIHYKASCL